MFCTPEGEGAWQVVEIDGRGGIHTNLVGRPNRYGEGGNADLDAETPGVQCNGGLRGIHREIFSKSY